MSAKGLSRMTIDVPEEDHKRLKTLAAITGQSMREIVLDWIHERLYGTHVPNAKTLKAIEQVEKKEGLINCDNVDDLFKKLDI